MDTVNTIVLMGAWVVKVGRCRQQGNRITFDANFDHDNPLPDSDRFGSADPMEL